MTSGRERGRCSASRKAESRAARAYQRILARFPASPVILRRYALFVEQVYRNHAEGAELTAAAEMIEAKRRVELKELRALQEEFASLKGAVGTLSSTVEALDSRSAQMRQVLGQLVGSECVR